MKMIKYKSLSRAAFTALSLLLLSGCQGMATNKVGFDSNPSKAGNIAQYRYAHISSAITALNQSLGNSVVTLETIPMATSLYSLLPTSELRTSESAANALRRIATIDIIGSSKYRLVKADTLTGRLEYRSNRTGSHLSITVRPPTKQEHANNLAFVVTEVFGQASLTALVSSLPSRDILRHTTGISLDHDTDLLKVKRQTSAKDDVEKLSYLNSLPAVERDREDLLSIRAMLMMRLDQDLPATRLVQKGIIRYPHSPMYFTLATYLFERKADVIGPESESLSAIMEQRFSRKDIKNSRQTVNQFLLN